MFSLLIYTKGHTKTVFSVYISPDNSRIYSGSEDKTIKIWGSKTYELIKSFEDPEVLQLDKILSVAYTPDGARIVTGSADNKIKIFE